MPVQAERLLESCGEAHGYIRSQPGYIRLQPGYIRLQAERLLESTTTHVMQLVDARLQHRLQPLLEDFGTGE